MNINKVYVNKGFFKNLLWIVIVYLIMYILNNNVALNSDIERKLFVFAWITNLCFLWCVYSLYRIKKNIFDFNILFILFLFLFCNGQVFLYSFGVDQTKLSVFVLSNIRSILNAEVYFCYSMLFFNLGSLFILLHKQKPLNVESNYITDKKFIKAIRAIAIVLVFISFIFYVPSNLTKVINSIRYGYEYLYDTAAVGDGMIIYLSKMFIPSLLLLLYSYNDKKIVRKIIILFLILIAGMNLIIGSRGAAISILVILIVYYNTYIERLNGKKVFIVFAIVLVIMVTIPTIYSFRSRSNKNVDTLFKTITEVVTDKDDGFITKTISELGYTMHSYILTYDMVPSNTNYKYGESYIASVLMLIPSKLLGGYSFAEKAALDTWLQETYGMSYGPGFSIVAETYYNFGWYFGIFFSFFLGLFYTVMFNLKAKDINKDKLLRILSLIFLYNSLLSARYPFHNTMRNVIYMCFIIYALILMNYGYLIRKERR